jgi:hypothetical protein
MEAATNKKQRCYKVMPKAIGTSMQRGISQQVNKHASQQPATAQAAKVEGQEASTELQTNKQTSS